VVPDLDIDGEDENIRAICGLCGDEIEE